VTVSLPKDAQARKDAPVWRGVLRYFPRAIFAVAECSRAGNRQHHPDKPLHWDMSKSTDEADACVRHLIEAGTFDDDGIRHSAKAAWRALANLERELIAAEEEAEGALSEEEKEKYPALASLSYSAELALTGFDYPDQRTPSGLPPAALDEHDDYPPA
jgi:hypothetical protein